MKVRCFLVFSLLLFGFIPNSSAQFPDNSPWEFGWETDVEPSYELMLDGDKWELEDMLYFYVENTRMNDLSLTISVEFDSDDELLEATFDEEISIESQENKTFSVELLSSNPDDVRGFSTDTSFSIKITATETAGTAEISSEEIEADLKVPRSHKLIPEATTPTYAISAGTWVEATLHLNNMGNSVDAAKAIEAEVRSCPLLDITGLDSALNVQVQPTGINGQEAESFTFRIEPSSAHPSRTCEVTISITSEGNNIERSVVFDIEIQDEDDSDSNSNSETDSGSSSSGSTDEDSSALPSLSFLTTFVLVGIAALTRSKND
ncbi:hypothetical protein N9295_00280 [bacterium]|nr:hypothetical protein [bacterium]MDB3879269.1 hypothetical protein [bacterium]